MKNKKYIDFYVLLSFFIFSLIYMSRFIFTGKMFYASDWILGGLTSQEWMVNHIKLFKTFAYWDPYIFCGYPTIGSFFAEVMAPTYILKLFIPVQKAFSISFMCVLALGLFGMYLFLKEMGIKLPVRIIISIIYGFSGFPLSTIYSGHLARMTSFEMFPLIFYLLMRSLKTKNIKYFILTGGTGGIALLLGHFQMTYYMFYTFLFFLLYYIISKRKEIKNDILKIIIYIAITILIPLLMYSVYIFPVYKNLPYGARGETRGYEFSTSWSMPPEETLTLINPYFSGILDNYWGRNYFKLHTEFSSIFLVLLFIGGLIYFRRETFVKFFIYLFGITLIFCWGGHTIFFRIFYHLIPGINKFRAPNLIFYQVIFSMCVIGALFLEKFNLKKHKKYLFYFSVALFAITFIFLILKSPITSVLSDFISSSLRRAYSSDIVMGKIRNIDRNYNLLLLGFLLSSVFSIIYSFLIIFKENKKIKEYYITIPFIVLILIEFLPINLKFAKPIESEEEYYKPDEVVQFLKKDKSIFRVFPLRYERSNDGILHKYGIYNIGGYGPNPLRIYQNYIGAGQSVMFTPARLMRYPRLIDMLNVKYIIDYTLPDDISIYPDDIKQQLLYVAQFFSQYEIVQRTQKYTIYNNPYTCERLYFTHNYIIEKDENKMLEKISDIEFSFNDSVFLFEKPNYERMNKKPLYYINVINFHPNIIEADVKTDMPGILVFSENWHPSWNVYVDGKKEKLLRVNYLYRGVELKEGEHNVKMVYNSKAEKIGIILTIIGYLIFISGFFIKKKDEKRLES